MNLPIKWDKILLPAKGVDPRKWAVVACDQYTSSPEYWERLGKEIGDAPSALNLILPEAFLGRDDAAAARGIAAKMREYTDGGIFEAVDGGVITVERTTVNHITKAAKTRRGIMLAVDLEAYSFVHSDYAPIRATEGTVVERVPPRAAVREACGLELPHIMLLVDDPGDTLIAPLFAPPYNGGRVLYDFGLNGGGGTLRGRLADGRAHVEAALSKLLAASIDKYGSSFLFGVGDGNHSLAAAKAVWQKTRNPKARYALCEVVNIYDEGLEFEPIHRVVTGAAARQITNYKSTALPPPLSPRAQSRGLTNKGGNLIVDGERLSIALPQDPIEAVAEVQRALDGLVKEYGGGIDYIHGKEDLEALCGKGSGNAGILLPAMPKGALFPYCAAKGALPRKTFSMGEAYEKRYYMEAREIR